MKWVLVVGLGAAVLGGASLLYSSTCNLVGCVSHLSIDTGVPWFEGITYEVEVCLDDECWEGATVANGSRDDDSGTIGLDRDGSISILLADEERPPPRPSRW